MKANTIIFFLILQSAGIAVGQNQEARDILLLSAQKLKENNLFQYEASYRIKYFDFTDTSAFTHYNCTVLKMPADTVLGYYARIYNEAEDRVYDGNNFLLVWHEGKKIIRDQPRLSGKKFARDNIRRDNVPHFFYYETPFQSYLSDAKNMTLSEDMLDGKKVWKVDVFFPTDEEITFLKRVVYIDPQTYFPLKVEGFAKFQDIQDEYSELILKNVRATVHAGDDFSSFYPYPADYAEEMVQTKQINYDLLPTGASFIPFEATDFTGAPKAITTSDADNQLILMDFWYLACAPCLRALPEIVKLHEKYKNQGLQVYGINPYDQLDKKREEILKFTNKFQVNYPLLFVDKTMPEKYLVKSYPTIYLIKNGKVIHASFRITEDKWKELDRLIEENLRG